MALRSVSLYLVDKSAWEQARYNLGARQRLEDLRAAGRLAVCTVSMAEMLYSARNGQDFARIRLDLDNLPFLSMTEATERLVIDTMAALAARGQHRTPIPDVMLASVAQHHSAIILHYDSDYERLAAVTGVRHEWIVPRGRGHAGHGP